MRLAISGWFETSFQKMSMQFETERNAYSIPYASMISSECIPDNGNIYF